jgi:competence protein ComEA
VPDPDPLPLPPRPPAPTGGLLEALHDRWHRWRRDPRVGVVVLLAAACIAGVFWFRAGIAVQPRAAAAGTTATTTSTATSTASPTTAAGAASTTVVVHVAGAVTKPGVVTLRAGSRVVDAIDAAGGARANADLDRLNLAAKLSDGERVAVPVRGQPAPPLEPTATSGDASSGADPSTPVNLNTASLSELETLPGIGPTLAQAIIDERERAGGFRSVDDLRRVRGIGDARFAQVQPLVTV